MKTILKIIGYLIAVVLMAAGLIAVVMYVMGLGMGNDPIKDVLNKVNQGDTTILTTMTPVDDTSPNPDGNVVLENTQQNGTSSVTVGTPSPSPTPTPEVTPSPETSPEATPSTDDSAEETPAPTPEVTPEPQAAGTPLGGGTFSSNTEKWIDIDAIWNAEAVDVDRVKITVTVNLRSYRIDMGEKRNALDITVGDESTAMDVAALNIDTKEEVTTELGTYDFTVNAPLGKATIIPLSANWHFGGTYSGAQLDVITAEGDIVIDR